MSCAIAVVRALRAVHTGVDPDYEKVLAKAYTRFLSQIPDPIIVDVGAYVGEHLAQFVNFGRTIAFEPVPEFADALSQRFRQADVRQMALGRAPSRAPFYFLPEASGMSGLQMRDTHGRTSVTQPISVQVETLDRQLADLPYLTYVKMDIEGGEVDCLAGGRHTIARLRPLISVEFGRPSYAAYGQTALTMFECARGMNYVPSDLFGNLIETESEWLTICDNLYWDYFLVPAERTGEWSGYFSD